MPVERPTHDYYEILQVHPKASLPVIKKAYRTLLLELGNHPDQGGSAHDAALITEAYRVLSDPEKRAAYDATYFVAAPEGAPREAPRAPEPETQGLVVLCPRCKTKNRVRSQALMASARCSRCRQALDRLPGVAGVPAAVAVRLARLPRFLGSRRRWAVGIPVALLAFSLLAVGYVLSDLMFAYSDPLTATDQLKKEGKLTQATNVLTRALDRSPGNPRLHEKLGDVYAKQLMFDEALAEYTHALRLNPQNSYLYALQGDTFLRLRRLGEAELSFRQALKLDPDQIAALVALGNVLAKREHFKEAAGLYQQALMVQPSADVLYNLGMVYQWDGQRQRAVDAFKQALIADPNHRSSMVSLASLHYEQGHYDMAAAQLIKASQLRHEDLDLHLRLADIFERTGRTPDAIREWEVCLAQGKANPAVLERAKRALNRLGVTTG